MKPTVLLEDVIVLKFGSSVLRSRADILSVVHEIYRWYRHGSRVVAVVSAIGKATEELLAQSRELSATPEPWATAELLATGERASAALLGIALDRAGIPGRVVNPWEIGLQVSGAALDGEPLAINLERTSELLRANPVLVVPGFFGTDTTGRTQLLGRGGSDLTAAWLSVALGARCRLLKDVDGIYETDPAGAAHPRRLTYLGYDDAMRVSGRLVQSKAVAHLQVHGASCEVAALERSYHSVVHRGSTVFAPDGHTFNHARPPLDVVLLGCGTVGFGVYQRLLALPQDFRVCGVLVRDAEKYARSGIDRSLLHTTVDTVQELKPQVAVDILPGVTPSREIVISYLTQGAHVVSANKAVVAGFGQGFAQLAHETGTTLRFSAAVGGSAPMLEAVSHAASKGRITKLEAVLNGTCNFLLDACARGETLADAVGEAQRRGFSEIDPSEDLSGRDAARKLELLAEQTFGLSISHWSVQEFDQSIAWAALEAAGRGRKLRQVARVIRKARDIIGSVRFEELDENSVLGGLEEEWNALTLTLASDETITVRGRGAGRWPTTEAIMADLFDVARVLQVP